MLSPLLCFSGKGSGYNSKITPALPVLECSLYEADIIQISPRVQNAGLGSLQSGSPDLLFPHLLCLRLNYKDNLFAVLTGLP